MQILIEIPNPPKKQDIIDIPLHFINGTVCETGGYGFQVLPPHGRLIDADNIDYNDFWYREGQGFTIAICQGAQRIIEEQPTIIEAGE